MFNTMEAYLVCVDVDGLDTVGPAAACEHDVVVAELRAVKEFAAAVMGERDVLHLLPLAVVPQLQGVERRPRSRDDLVSLKIDESIENIWS